MSQIHDLLEDLEFIRWVKYPDEELNTFWSSWMQANPERVNDVKFAREIILGLEFPSITPSDQIKAEVLTTILKGTSLSSTDKVSGGYSQARMEGKRNWQLFRIAAMISGVIFLSFALFNWKGSMPEQEVKESINWITKSTNSGEKLTFRLPDQTMVWLNSKSSLTFPESFDSTVRLVVLKGEGFFEVSENPEQPFQVLSDSLITTALGTSFNVTARSGKEIKVSLVTGKVMIHYKTDTLNYFLTPGKELKYNTNTGSADLGSFNEEGVSGWRFGKLNFKRASLGHVVKSLEDWYGVEFLITGSARSDWRFTGKFENQTLENILYSMSNVERFTYTIKDKKVTIAFNP